MILVIVLATLFLDQLSKFLVLKNLSVDQSIPLIKNVFYISLVYNRGAAFGIFKNYLFLLIGISASAIILIFLTLKERGLNRLYRISLGLILAGALGNLIDRLSYGYVIDFLDFRVWPVFNAADSAITVGAVLLGWIILTSSKSKNQNSK